jgi:membrane protease YdiL (CAAX protease family)
MNTPAESKNRTVLLVVAWGVMLLVSFLPVIILQEMLHISTLYPTRVMVSLAFLGVMLLLTFIWHVIRPLREYFIIFIILFAAEGFFYGLVGNLPAIDPYMETKAFVPSMFATQVLRMAVSLVMLAGLMVMKKKRDAFYLVKGDLGAIADPIPWVMRRPTSWKVLGRALSLILSLGTLAFLLIAAFPSFVAQFNNGTLGSRLGQVLVLIPLVLLFAAMNAFSEELTYKASFLSVLNDPVGKRQALLLMATFFGLGHYYGVPYGIVGVLMAGLLGWLLGKSMLETKGFFWAWFIHFLQDVLIFSFMALGSVSPGGQ